MLTPGAMGRAKWGAEGIVMQFRPVRGPRTERVPIADSALGVEDLVGTFNLLGERARVEEERQLGSELVAARELHRVMAAAVSERASEF